ncbi:MAG: bifunctional folylpolyglutamate synthase/dihydrofolate synthase [Clostridia bacterium]|nr:bifunctional folylpolyglutamate synthase/dihydrofolate synthase [Clostridia bacterium]
MTPQEAISYIENYTWSTTRLGLDRTRQLLAALGNPQKSLKFIHVTGSNGKGSTCSMLDSILRSQGYKVGLYTSPYIQEFGERMRVNGQNIPGEKLAELTEKVKKVADAMEDHPSQFELVTAIAMQYFADEKCHIVVLEVGMGGALDSTNAIDAPEVAVVTNIGLEHTEYLGDTLEKIALTKAGIIKAGCNCVCYDGDPIVTEVMKSVCKELNVSITCVDSKKLQPISETLDGQKFIWEDKEYNLALLGKFQLYNVTTVFEVVRALKARGWNISDEAVEKGLASVKWPARLEILEKNPLFILDGGHNPQCADALAEALKNILGDKKAVMLMGVLADKDYPQILDTIMPFAKEFICLTPFSDRALSAEKLAAFLTEKGKKAYAVPGAGEPSHDVSPEAEKALAEGIKLAKEAAGEDGAIVCFGSLYLVGHIRTIFGM